MSLVLRQIRTWHYVTIIGTILCTACIVYADATTKLSVNRGAARQIYGSSSLRHSDAANSVGQLLSRERNQKHTQDSLKKRTNGTEASKNEEKKQKSLSDSRQDDKIEVIGRCRNECQRDFYLCHTSCVCISIENLCDGTSDCENDEDETDCVDEDLPFVFPHCSGKRNISCPVTNFCIAKEWLCDGDDDCGDFSDESHCGMHANCTDDQFECNNGLCIPRDWRCDADNDCQDFSDELNCTVNKKCDLHHFPCLDGSCISRAFRCDSEEDCEDGSDELNCEVHEVHCKKGEFQCAHPKCVLEQYKCDGEDDCGDGSDEENCLESIEVSCRPDEFRCSTGQCINKKLLCDNQMDCPNEEDESKCEPAGTCSPNEFACLNGICILKQAVCDGIPDCPNYEDESGCPLRCELNQFHCNAMPPINATSYSNLTHPNSHRYHHCIFAKYVCDGVPDCPLGDDEMNCSKPRKCIPEKDKCTQLCTTTHDNKTACACEVGFSLGLDSATCEDINECEFEKEPVCSQLCNNTVGSFLCGCKPGYVLRPDLRTCKALGAKPSLIFASRVDIREISISNSKFVPIIKGLENAVALDYHYKLGVIYWSDVTTDRIKKMYVNGSNPEDVIRWGLDIPNAIAIDWIHDLLFWTDAGTQRIEVITLDTKIRHVLISNDLEKPRALALHPNYGYVFWTDWGTHPKIERAEMDGSGRQALITELIFWPNGLTIDYTTDRLYWIDAKYNVIESSHLDGSDRRKIMSRGLHHPFAITVFEDTIFWTDWRFNSIALAEKTTGRGFKTIYSGHFTPLDIRVYHPQRQPDFLNHCTNGNCSHMCLPNSTGYTCVCPVGLKLQKDGKNCGLVNDDLLIFVRQKDLRLLPIDQAPRVFDTIIPVDHVRNAAALTWDSKTDTIYWTDLGTVDETGTINKAHLNGTNQIIVVNQNLKKPYGLGIDWVTNKLYWTDSESNWIECSNLDGSMRDLLIYDDLDYPRDIALDPFNGYMYWTSWGNKPRIERAGMNGKNRKILFNIELEAPNGLTIDYQTQRLYWADVSRKRIEYSTLDGKNRNTFLVDLSEPFDLVIHKNKIYWTDRATKAIHTTDKTNSANVSILHSGVPGLTNLKVFHRNRRHVNNPCDLNNGNCTHLCLLAPSPKRYECACPTGLRLKGDGKTCQDIPNKFLVLAHRVNIRILSLDVNYFVDTVLPLNNLRNCTGVDVYRRTGEIFWTDPSSHVIKKCSFDGKNVMTIVEGGLDTVDSLAIDSVGKKIYWTDAGLKSIEVSELDGTNRRVLICYGLQHPRAIALHYQAGFMFWTDWGHNPKIERANMDGSDRTTIIEDELVWPNGISIDFAENNIYWNDAKRKVIERSDFGGQNRRILVKDTGHPYGLAVMGDFVYWTDWLAESLLRVNKSTGSGKKVIVQNLQALMDVAAVSDKIHGKNVCGNDNGGCSHLCLRRRGGYSCTCPTGILLNNDEKTCNTTPTNFLLLATKKAMAIMSFDTPEMRELVLPIADMSNTVSVDYHWNRRIIIYTDVSLKVIRSVSMNNFSDTKTIFAGTNASVPFIIAVDWIADNIYWTDMNQQAIYVARIDGSSRKKLIDNVEDAKCLELFPQQGYMFWTQWGKNAKIERALLNGANRLTIVTRSLAYPSGLTIDYEKKKLYWADALKNRIEMSDLHGEHRTQVVPEAKTPFGLTLFRNYIYWGDWVKRIWIERVNKVTGTDEDKIRTSLGGTTELKAISAERQTGWTPCAEVNGGCSHLCFYARDKYTCACPDVSDGIVCSEMPSKTVPLRKPGMENDPIYSDIDNEDEMKKQEIVTWSNSRGYEDDEDKYKDDKFNREKSYVSLRTVVITIVVMLVITLAIVAMIIYLLCQRKTKQKKYMYTGRRNVLTFSNPNYNASSGDVGSCTQPQVKKSCIWKRLKYDKSQERVYEDNGQTSSPEVLSLIPPSATPSSSRAASMTLRESSPPLTHATQLNT